jgi:hypothetical protein
MRPITFLAALIGVALIGWPANSQQAAADSRTTCRFANEMTVSPGVGAQTSSGTYTSDGETGTLDCTGPVNGHEPTGRGREGNAGRYGDTGSFSCASVITGDGKGTVTFTLVIPTSAGNQRIVSRGTFTLGGKVPTHGGAAAGTFETERFSGSFEVTPEDGYCLTPITRAHVTGEGTLP